MTLAIQFFEWDAAHSDGEPEYPVAAWDSVFSQLNDQELADARSLGVEFFFGPHEGSPLWDRVRGLLDKWMTDYAASF